MRGSHHTNEFQRRTDNSLRGIWLGGEYFLRSMLRSCLDFKSSENFLWIPLKVFCGVNIDLECQEMIELRASDMILQLVSG